jgi:hypothetical protein
VWIAKLKSDQQEAGADIAVLATITLPKGDRERLKNAFAFKRLILRPAALSELKSSST